MNFQDQLMHLFISRIRTRALAMAALLLLGTGGLWAQVGAGGRGGVPTGGGGGAGAGGGGFTGGGGGTSGSNGVRQYQNTTMVGDAMITSDVDTRRIIIVTDDETNDNIKKVIAGLDAPKPQVLINVVFLQVTHEND